jgi:anti-sigma B factor antagonist
MGINYGAQKMSEEQILKVESRLDSGNVDILKNKTSVMIDSGVPGIILDFSDTKFIDSIGLGSLVSILKQTTQNDIKIVLCSLSPQVRQIFELTRLYRLFDIFDSIEDAKESLAS